MNRKLSALFAEVPPSPSYKPEAAVALKVFASLPPSTGVFANPVRYQLEIPANGTPIMLDIRSFGIRGKLFEEDIINGNADAFRIIFVGLFDRIPSLGDAKRFSHFIEKAFKSGLAQIRKIAEFMELFPDASPEIVMQHCASLRKAIRSAGAVNASRIPEELLAAMIEIHMENVAVAAVASYMRDLKPKDLVNGTRSFIRRAKTDDPFRLLFSLLLRRIVNDDEMQILGQMGAIQVHHGSAGSNMVARYFASLHTRSISDLFTASQMALDCGRHFGAISDMTGFVRVLERTPLAKRDSAIRDRILQGNLPTFGHPEISAAGRDNHLEADPRPSLYLEPLFHAIDRGTVTVTAAVRKRAGLLERIYQIALIEGVEKAKGGGRLRLTPNTDFGAWLVQEVLGIGEADRTIISYAYRGFGWMMDVREQLQQPIIRPVIPPDPAIVPADTSTRIIPDMITTVHSRLAAGGAFHKLVLSK
jgi:citrate synthase